MAARGGALTPRGSLAGAALLTAPALLLYLLVLLVPLGMVAALSFQGFDVGRGGILPEYSLGNYADLAGDSVFHEALLRTLRVAALTTGLCVLLGVPEALVIQRLRPRWRGFVLLAVLGPLLVSVVVRTFGWMVLLGDAGLVNRAAEALGLPGAPYRLMYTEGAVVAGLVHVMVPFVVLSVWASLQRFDPALARAAGSLGAGPLTTFRRVVWPAILPGVLGGAVVVFCLSASAFATPHLLGGRRLKVVATLTYGEFLNTLNWPLGAAIAVCLLATILAVSVLWTRLVERPVLRRLGAA